MKAAAAVLFLLALPFAACYAVSIIERQPAAVAVLLFAGAMALVGKEL